VPEPLRLVMPAIVDEHGHGGSKQEREMRMGNRLWSIVVGGVVGALLWAGPVIAQPFPGSLPACVRQLNYCNADLKTCQTDLEACQAEPSVVFPGDGWTAQR